jgi:hypothetical protein
MDIGKGNAKFFRQRSFPHYLFAGGNRDSTRLISSVAVSIASRKAISLAGDGRPSNAASLRHNSMPATRQINFFRASSFTPRYYHLRFIFVWRFSSRLARRRFAKVIKIEQFSQMDRRIFNCSVVGRAMGESDQPLWKELYTQAFMDADRENVTLLLFAAELAMVERSRQLLNAPDQHEELTELAVAKAALETIRFRKLGWPPVAAN